MKKKLLQLIALSFFIFSIISASASQTEKEVLDSRGIGRLGRNAMNNTVKILSKRYQLKCMGFGEAAFHGPYTEMSLSFQIDRPLSKDEGRKMLLDAAQEFLKAINSNEQLKPYLDPSPFEINSIVITIFPNEPDGRDVFYPNIAVFKLIQGNITYKSDTPKGQNKGSFFLRETESYEEALKIVESQKDQNALKPKPGMVPREVTL